MLIANFSTIMNERGRLLAAIGVTAATTAVVIEALRYYCNSRRSNVTKAEPKNTFSKAANYSEELILEQLARNYAFLSPEGMSKVRDQRIVVVGAGGVGSWVATMLARSGVGALRIVDFDQVSLSSLNRHAVATISDVGSPKVECLKTHLKQIAPWIHVEGRNQLWNLKSAEALIFGGDFRPTYVVDCIDNIDTKVDLLAFCHEKGLKVISSGGAACKSDPSRINISDISKTEEDPLSRSVRVRLKKRGIISDIPVAFSAEKPDPRKAQLLPLSESEIEKGDVDQLSAIQNFRVRILPVLGTMPGMFGLTLATYIITSVAGYPIEPIEGKNRYKIYDSLLQSLAGQQSRIGEPDQRVPIALSDVSYILEEVFHGKSPVSLYSTKLTLSRWDPKKPISFQNVVVLTKEEQRYHEDHVLKGGEKAEECYQPEVIERVQKRFEEERYYSQYR